MCVAEHGKSTGVHGGGSSRGVGAGLRRLIWKAVDQVKIDAVYLVAAQWIGHTRRQLLALDSIGLLLEHRVRSSVRRCSVHPGR